MGFFYNRQSRRMSAYDRRRRRGRLVGWFFFTASLLCFLAAGGIAGYIYYHFSKDLPDYTSIKDFRPNLISRIYARDGQLIGEFYAEKRIEVPYSRLPRQLIAAFVASEDARFFEHPGVDLFGIVRAFIHNLKAGDIVQGGSTITQQVVKSILLTSEKSFGRKVREAILAYRIDNYMAKEDILNLYLNHIFLGNGAYGVEAAAQEYFGKHVEDLNLAECALLAGLPKAPSRYSPKINPMRAKERQAYVLGRMVEAGFIRQEEATAALNQPITLKPMRQERFDEAGYYCEYVRSYLEEKYGRDPLYTAGFKVYTAADVDLHRAAKEAVNQGLSSLYRRHGYRGPLKHLTSKEIDPYCQRQKQKFLKNPPHRGQLQTAVVVQLERGKRGMAVRFGDEFGLLVKSPPSETGSRRGGIVSDRIPRLRVGDVIQVRLLGKEPGQSNWLVTIDPDPMAQAALVYVENHTGKVRVITGGKDFRDSIFNRAVQAKRQPGSAFKPVIYAAAVEKGYGPNSILLDEPLSLPGGRRGAPWVPKNYDNTFSGPIPLATALARSRNIPSVRLMMSIGVPAVVNMGKQLGLSTEIYPNYSSALGSSEVTLFDLTRAYSVFPNDGKLAAPIVIERLEDRDGRILEEHLPHSKQVISVDSARTMTELLIGVVERGTGTRVKVLGRPIGGKTGTTNKTRDAWFIGFTPAVTAGVWVGMDDEHTLGGKETGGQAAAPIFISFMREALKNQPVEEFPEVPARAYARGGSSSEYDDEASEEEEEDDSDETTAATRQQVQQHKPTKNLFKSDVGEE
jgi:penicillin-binding protein 1A